VLSAHPKSRQLGFSLVELLIGIVIMGVLASLAMPGFRAWMQNIQIRNAAESFTNGLQQARAAAVSRNSNARFVMCSDTGTAWDILSASASAVSQTCNDVDAGTPTGWERVQKRDSSEGSKNVTVTVLPAGATTITFNNFGSVGVPPNQPLNADGSAPFTQIDLTASGGDRDLRVTVGVGGNARMCDPHVGSGPSKC
jgi:type IV fimbrial biogenesis protein FimT